MWPRPVRTIPGTSMQRSNRSGTRSAGRRALVQRCAALALLPLLSGCVAAAAIAVPAMTAAGVLTERKAAPREASAAAAPATGTVSVEGVPPLAAVAPARGATAQVTSLTALPPPTAADLGVNPWSRFVDYTLERSAPPTSGTGSAVEPAKSALLAPEGISSLTAQRRPCGGSEPAVIIDLDSGPAAFAPESAGLPSPGLAAALARLREAGVVVLWISRADANRVNDVGDALRRTGLDPSGRDPLLLLLNEDDRKQTLREEANEDVCVLAIAGDQRADFDELFNYLRTPDAAIGLETLIGAGWFITPVPLPPAPGGAE